MAGENFQKAHLKSVEVQKDMTDAVMRDSSVSLAGLQSSSTIAASEARKHYAWEGKFMPCDGLRHFYCVVNRTGGQGKTMVTQSLGILLQEGGRKLNIFAADTTVAADMSGSKLSRILPGVRDFGIGPNAKQLKDNPASIRSFWDEFGQILSDTRVTTPILLDVGANVVDSILTWARDSRAYRVLSGSPGQPAKVASIFIIPYVASPQAIADALSIARSLVLDNLFPIHKIYFIENTWQGPFDAFKEDPAYKEIQALAKLFGQESIKIEACHVDLLRVIEKANIPFVGLVDRSVDAPDELYNNLSRLAAGANMTPFAVAREYDDVIDWAKSLKAALLNIKGVMPLEAKADPGLNDNPA